MAELSRQRNCVVLHAGAILAAMFVLAQPAAAASPCPAPPPAVRDLSTDRFYKDGAGSVVDAEKARQHAEAVRPLSEFLSRVVAETDKAVRKHDRAMAACPLSWLEAWAQGGALLGHMGSRQAEYQRKWDLAGLALAFLKLKPYATDADRRRIEPWLIELADVSLAFFDDRARKRNNHWYWMGLAAAATALATDSERHWQAARAIMRDAAGDIGADGTLPMELEREARALRYHAFSATAIVTLAELGAALGEDWYALNGGAVHRLVRVTAEGLAQPARFAEIARHEQEPQGAGGGWLALYRLRFPDRLKGPLPEVPQKHRWLGGDVVVLSDVLNARSRRQ